MRATVKLITATIAIIMLTPFLANAQGQVVQAPADPPVAEVVETPEVAEVAEPDPVTLADVVSSLNTAVTAMQSNAVTVAASAEARDTARTALEDAESAHADAMTGETAHGVGIRDAATSLVEFVTAEYLQ